MVVVTIIRLVLEVLQGPHEWSLTTFFTRNGIQKGSLFILTISVWYGCRGCVSLIHHLLDRVIYWSLSSVILIAIYFLLSQFSKIVSYKIIRFYFSFKRVSSLSYDETFFFLEWFSNWWSFSLFSIIGLHTGSVSSLFYL